MENGDIRRFLGLLKDKFFLFKIQLLISFFALGVFSWDIVTRVKKIKLRDYDLRVYPWTYIFFHPRESNMFNYIFLCVTMGLFGLAVYLAISRKNIEYIKSKIVVKNQKIFIILIVSTLAMALLPPLSELKRIQISFLILLAPSLYFFELPVFVKRRAAIILTGVLLLLISSEPLLVVKGPVYLMNEYEGIYEETYINGQYINNLKFLESLNKADVDTVKTLFAINNISNIIQGEAALEQGLDFQKKSEFKKPEVPLSISAIDEDSSLWDETMHANRNHFWEKRIISEGLNYKNFLESIKQTDLKTMIQFYKSNALEYEHQNMQRGQINHIGHILNPINEYRIGRPVKDIYMQYGLGDTFIMKWTMDLFGGISIDNYYKCYVYYVIYSISFLLMLYLLFKDSLYIFGGFAFLAFAFFFQGFIGFMLAPGIIPTIHFLDAPAVILLLLFFRRNNVACLGLMVIFSLLAIIINRQFGMILEAAVIISFFLYVIENKKGSSRLLWLLTIFFMIFSGLAAFHYANTGTAGQTFSYFLLGFFSWPANSKIIISTICYFVVSYWFMFMLKDTRHYLKYLYLFVFMYTQGLFVYYYWSGLSNHLPTVVPFAGLQLLLMIYIGETLLFKDRAAIKKMLSGGMMLLLLLLAFATMLSAKNYYRDKFLFRKNFADHRTYNWRFERASLVSTIDPEPVRESISLIHKYSAKEKGLYIISRYDNLLPYLSGRYSLMPFFDMQWHLISGRETTAAVDNIRSHKPDYVFVDTNINNFEDPWSKLFMSTADINERISRVGRYRELQKIFAAVSGDYEKIESGTLLSVYARKSFSVPVK